MVYVELNRAPIPNPVLGLDSFSGARPNCFLATATQPRKRDTRPRPPPNTPILPIITNYERFGARQNV